MICVQLKHIFLFIIRNILQCFCRICCRVWKSISKIDPTGRYVFISGCDSGIGHELAIELDRNGFNVIASVLDLSNVRILKSVLSTKAIVFRLDIRKQEDIDAAYDLVRRITTTLYGLVNNAGIITHGCIDWTSMETIRQMMDVNFFGHVALTKKFLPLLLAKPYSRVIFMGSVTGFFAFPQTAAYSASKHALKSFSDCLRQEMSPWNLRVSIVEPGTVKTGMLDNFVQKLNELWNELPIDTKLRWGESYLQDTINGSVNSPFMKYPDDPSRVIKAIQHALTSYEPQLQYRPGWQSKFIFNLFHLSPTGIIDYLLTKGWNLIPDNVRARL